MVASTTLCNNSEEESTDALESSWFYFEAGIETSYSLLLIAPKYRETCSVFLHDLHL